VTIPAGLFLLALATAIAVTFIPLSSDRVKDRIVAALSDHFDSDVRLGSLTLRTWPGLHVEGSSLVVRQKGRTDVPPLITVRNFTVDTSVMDLWRRRIAKVTLDGLDIEIPPERKSDDRDTSSEGGSALPAAAHAYLIERLESADARLAIIPREKGKAPKVWAIHQLHMRNVGTESPMPFDARLTNAIPPGEIDASGSFGPWQRDEPGRTPLEGSYTFQQADLSVFHGIAGMLSSKGAFSHTLNHIEATGQAEVPDFTIRVSGHPFPLKTTFHTVVDGTNGDTILQRIDAQFLSSSLVASGKVVDTPAAHGRTVSLDITMDHARLEDLMLMAVKAPKPPMVGGLKMQTAFLLPPGEADVVDRLHLNGRFAISNARFTSSEVQAKINELSHKGRGRAETMHKETVVSDFNGTFKLGDGTLKLPAFAFAVPGARVKLSGAYFIRPENLDFHGDLLMDASLSETQSGIKRMLLKVVDPFFRKEGGGSSLPIKITGKRSDPSFGLDMHRVLHRDR
jgi:hypothetical protein